MLTKKLFLAALAMAAFACGDSGGSGQPSQNPGPIGNQDGDTGSDAGNGGEGANLDAGGGGDGDPADAQQPNPDLDGGSEFVPDAAFVDDSGALQGSGSCCAEHDTPGCNNADLMVCVCEKDPTCCSTAWGKQCVFIVEQKYCQPGVRECVTDPDGQWKLTECLSDWSDFCESVAELKCGAVPGCF